MACTSKPMPNATGVPADSDRSMAAASARTAPIPGIEVRWNRPDEALLSAERDVLAPSSGAAPLTPPCPASVPSSLSAVSARVGDWLTSLPGSSEPPTDPEGTGETGAAGPGSGVGATGAVVGMSGGALGSAVGSGAAVGAFTVMLNGTGPSAPPAPSATEKAKASAPAVPAVLAYCSRPVSICAWVKVSLTASGTPPSKSVPLVGAESSVYTICADVLSTSVTLSAAASIVTVAPTPSAPPALTATIGT